MRDIKAVIERIHYLASTRETYSGKAKAITAGFKSHNERVYTGKETYEVSAHYNVSFFDCEVQISTPDRGVIKQIKF